MRASVIGLAGRLVLCGVFVGTVVSAAQQPESSLACEESGEPLRLTYGQYATGCAINSSTDLDRFVVAATVGDTLRITLQTTTPGLDPHVEIRDPLGVQIGTTSCSGHANGAILCSFAFDQPIATAGDHELAVFEGGADTAGNYVLQVERVFPVPPVPVLPYSLAVQDRIDPATDRDCMTWEATADTQVQVTLRTLTAGLDPQIQVLDPTGATIATPSCSGHANGAIRCTAQSTLTPALTGTYAFCIRELGANAAGDYEITLQCVFGSCPNPNHPPQLASLAPQTGAIGQPLQVNVSASDLDDDAIQLSAAGIPAGAVFTDRGDGTGSLSWESAVAGEFHVTFTASDNATPPQSDRAEVVITVGPLNHAPSLPPPPSQAVRVGDAMTLSLEASDADGDELRFSSSGLPEGAAITDHEDGTATLAWTPRIDQIGPYEVTVVVTDDGVPPKNITVPVQLFVTPPAMPESSVACDEASEPLPLNYGQYTTGCAVNPSTDLDRFVVAATAGDTLRITLQSTTPGLDPHVEIRDPLGVQIGTTSCSGHANGAILCSLVFDQAIATSGDHQLAASEGGADVAGNYVLQVERLFPVPPVPVLPYNLAVQDRIDPATDRDCMAWQATADSQVRVTLRTLTAGLDPQIQVLDPTGATVATPSCSGHANGAVPCTVQATVTPAMTGTYAFCIRELGANAVGSFEIDLQCLFGDCSATPGGSTTTTSSSTSTTSSTSTSSTSSSSSSTTTSVTTSSTTTTQMPSTTSTSTTTVTTTTTLSTTTSVTVTTTTLRPTTTTMPGGCEIAATFASIDCRLDALIAEVDASTDVGTLKSGLVRQLERAKSRHTQTEMLAGQDERSRARAALRHAIRWMIGFVHRVNAGKGRQQIGASTREMLSREGRSIMQDMQTLLRQSEALKKKRGK